MSEPFALALPMALRLFEAAALTDAVPLVTLYPSKLKKEPSVAVDPNPSFTVLPETFRKGAEPAAGILVED